jgi:hypothetical protein
VIEENNFEEQNTNKLGPLDDNSVEHDILEDQDQEQELLFKPNYARGQKMLKWWTSRSRSWW